MTFPHWEKELPSVMYTTDANGRWQASVSLRRSLDLTNPQIPWVSNRDDHGPASQGLLENEMRPWPLKPQSTAWHTVST